jgi:predicted ATP-grasp superfamily ATP-dependent carboligase
VHVARSDEHALALASRYVGQRLRWHEGDDAARRDSLIDICRSHRLEGFTLIPTGDADAALIAREHDALAEHFRLTTPPWEVLRLAHDKRMALAAASDEGLAVPLTLPLDEALEQELQFPVIVKPAMHEAGTRLPPTKAWRADDRAELLRLGDWLRCLADSSTLMVQELIPGDEQLSFAALCRDGRALAGLCARRTRQYPIDFGRASTYVETIDDASVAADAQRLLARIGFTGIVEVEFKRDPRTGENKLLDVNPRIGATFRLFVSDDGTDVLRALYLDLTGQEVPTTTVPRGRRWVVEPLDLKSTIAYRRRGDITLGRWVRSFRGVREAAWFARDDLRPFLVLWLRLVTDQLSGWLRRR